MISMEMKKRLSRRSSNVIVGWKNQIIKLYYKMSIHDINNINSHTKIYLEYFIPIANEIR